MEFVHLFFAKKVFKSKFDTKIVTKTFNSIVKTLQAIWKNPETLQAEIIET